MSVLEVFSIQLSLITQRVRVRVSVQVRLGILGQRGEGRRRVWVRVLGMRRRKKNFLFLQLVRSTNYYMDRPEYIIPFLFALTAAASSFFKSILSTSSVCHPFPPFNRTSSGRSCVSATPSNLVFPSINSFSLSYFSPRM